MDPTIFGDDVVDGVDNVMASHVNNLRAWAWAFTPIIANMTTVSTTDTTHTLTDTDTAFQVFAAIGSTDFKVYLPAASTDNHPFWMANESTDGSANIQVLSSSSDDIEGANDLKPGECRPFISSGNYWYSLYI